MGVAKIVRLEAENIKGIKAVDITVPAVNVIRIIGANEQSKTSVLDAITMAIGRGTCEEIFNLAVDFIHNSNSLPIGQVLWERQGSHEWVHISNPKTVLFQPDVARMVASKLVVGYGLDGRYYHDKPWN